MKVCVINFARGGHWYVKGQKRLKENFLKFGYMGDFFLYSNESQLGCPSHEKMPYAFKAYAFQKAIEADYTRIIWCDSSMYLYNDQSLGKMGRQLDKDGYMFALNGWNTGQWCSDAALSKLKITREESFNIPHIMANSMGFDTNNEKAREFLKQYYSHAKDGSFRGAWKNVKSSVSSDPRVLGHRHDQTAGSVIAWRLGMQNLLKNWTSYDPNNKDPRIVFLTHPA